MIRRSTVVYLVLLLLLAGAYYYLNKREKPADIGLTAEPSPQVTPAYLFAAAQGAPTSIRIESKSGKTVEVVRGADNAWALTQPIETKADQGAAEAAASQITTMRILDSVPDLDPKIVGLDIPEYVLTIKFTSGVEQKVDIGVVTPTESGYYVHDMAGKIVIVSKDAIDSLVTLLDNPPYLETLTLVPSTPEAGTPPSETATP